MQKNLFKNNFRAIYYFRVNRYHISAEVKFIPLQFKASSCLDFSEIFFVASLDCLLCERKWWLPCEHNTNQRFGKKNPEVLPDSWKFNGNIFFSMFFRNVNVFLVIRLEKLSRWATKENAMKNSRTAHIKTLIYCDKAYLWIVSAL